MNRIRRAVGGRRRRGGNRLPSVAVQAQKKTLILRVSGDPVSSTVDRDIMHRVLPTCCTIRCAHATSACVVAITAAMALRSSAALIGFET